MGTVVYGVCILLCISIASSIVSRFSKYTYELGYECGKELFHETNVSDNVRCSLRCSNNDYCLGFTFEPKAFRCIGCEILTSFKAGSQTGIYKRGECQGWIRPLNGLKIDVFLEQKTQPQARADCQSRRGRLVKIDDASKMDHISSALKTCTSYSNEKDYWTDGVNLKRNVSNGWTFFDGADVPMDQDKFWSPGEPNDAQSFNITCIRLTRLATGTYRWDDSRCMATFPYICEY